jgi:hypothetical protein
MTKKQLISFIIATIIFLLSTFSLMWFDIIPENIKNPEGSSFFFPIFFILIFIPLVLGYIGAVLLIFYSKNQIMQMKQFSVGLIAGLFFIILGLIFIGLMMQGSIKSVDSENWPSVQGAVLSSEIITRTEREPDSHFDDYYYTPKVSYNYTVNGNGHTSDRIAFIVSEEVVKNEVQKIIDNYPVGKTVTVYYNPDNPSEAVLEPGIKDSGSMICGTTGSLIFIIFGALIVLGTVKKQKIILFKNKKGE